jgi:hypothetical protein
MEAKAAGIEIEKDKAYDFFCFQGFLPIERASYPLFKGYEDSMLQERSATIIVAWADAHRGLYKIIRGCLCSVFFFKSMPIYFALHRSPENDCSLQQLIDILYDLSCKAGLPFLQINVIDENTLKEYENVDGYDIKTECKYSEYAYKTRDLLDLSGKINYYKRKRLNKFLDKEDISLLSITKDNVRLCSEIEKEWCRYQDCSQCASYYGCEKDALMIMEDLFNEHSYKGLIGYQNNTPIGYIICEKINEKIAFLCFGKGVIRDFFIYLIYMMFKEHLTDVDYMNFNDDMDNFGLRMFKRKLSAYKLWHRYSCTFTRRGQG